MTSGLDACDELSHRYYLGQLSFLVPLEGYKWADAYIKTLMSDTKCSTQQWTTNSITYATLCQWSLMFLAWKAFKIIQPCLLKHYCFLIFSSINTFKGFEALYVCWGLFSYVYLCGVEFDMNALFIFKKVGKTNLCQKGAFSEPCHIFMWWPCNSLLF